MPPYTCPETGSYDILRFVRHYDNIFVGNTINDRHKDIVRMDEIAQAIEQTRKAEPGQVDAGFVEFMVDGTIKISQDSDRLGLPVCGHTQEAREITLKCFQEQSPNRRVTGGVERF